MSDPMAQHEEGMEMLRRGDYGPPRWNRALWVRFALLALPAVLVLVVGYFVTR